MKESKDYAIIELIDIDKSGIINTTKKCKIRFKNPDSIEEIDQAIINLKRFVEWIIYINKKLINGRITYELKKPCFFYIFRFLTF